jgi:outer membrane protein OmpA-like peptidoglycan-associated protein
MLKGWLRAQRAHDDPRWIDNYDESSMRLRHLRKTHLATAAKRVELNPSRQTTLYQPFSAPSRIREPATIAGCTCCHGDFMHRSLALASLAAYAVAAPAAPDVGQMNLLSAPGTPFHAEFPLLPRSPADLANLQAGLMTRGAQKGSAMREWERDLTFRLDNRDGRDVLVARAAAPLQDELIDLTLGLDSPTGSITRDYALNFRDGAWVPVPVGADLRTVAVQSNTHGERPAGESGMRLSSGLSFVIPFADGRVSLGPKGRAAVAELVEAASDADRIQVKGWAGSQATDREQMAFNRAYTVQYNLRQLGIAEDRIRIVSPRIALSELDAVGDEAPRVVATLLAARGDDEIAHVDRLRDVRADHGTARIDAPAQLAMSQTLTGARQ